MAPLPRVGSSGWAGGGVGADRGLCRVPAGRRPPSKPPQGRAGSAAPGIPIASGPDRVAGRGRGGRTGCLAVPQCPSCLAGHIRGRSRRAARCAGECVGRQRRAVPADPRSPSLRLCDPGCAAGGGERAGEGSFSRRRLWAGTGTGVRNASPQFCPARPQRDDGRKRGSGARGVGCRPALPTPLCPLSRRSLRGRCPRPRTRCCCSSWRGPSSPSGCCGAGGAGRGDASPSRPPRAPRSRRRSRFCFSRTAKAEPPSAPGGAAAGSRGPLGAVGRPAGAQTAAGSGRCQAGAQPGPPPRIKVAFLARLWLCVLPWGVGGHPVGIPRRAPSLCHPAVRSLRAPNEAGALRAAPPVRGRARCQPAPRVGSGRFGSVPPHVTPS